MKLKIFISVILLLVCAGSIQAQVLTDNATVEADSPQVRVPMQPTPKATSTTLPAVVNEKGTQSSSTLSPASKVSPAFTMTPQSAFEEAENAAVSIDPYNRLVWGDFDGDGLQDLLVLDLNGNHLLRNQGNGDFEDVTDLAFHEGPDRGISGSWGDFNNDGLLDLFLFHSKGFTLYRNDGRARFTDVTEAMNLDPKLVGSGAKVEDYDGDGLPDLIVKTPRGDRIFNNHEGRGFDKVELPGLTDDENNASTTTMKENIQSVSIPSYGTPNPGDVTPTGDGPPPYSETYPTDEKNDDSAQGLFDFNTLFLNDNSPGSIGTGIPEVEGGNDDTKLNDIVDHTIAGTDLEVPFELIGTTGPAPTTDTLFNAVNTSSDAGSIGVRGESTAADGVGVTGVGFHGVHGEASGTTGENAGVIGETSSPGGYGVYGEGSNYGVSGLATAASSWSWGVRGEIAGTKGHGVAGYATSATGNTFGVLGRSYSDEGKGVYGYASASSGENFGVLGQSNSPDGNGVRGEALATTGHAYGVYGLTNANIGRGVFGESLATSGETYGVYGLNNGNAGAGVGGKSPYMALYGYCTGNSGFGVYGQCNNSGGTGVKGNGLAYGVLGTTNAEEGYGIFGEAERYGIRGNATGSTGYSYGVRGDSSSTGAWAVYGSATASTGLTRGVYGYSASSYGTGVYGWASATSGDTYGVFGKCESPDGVGVYGVCSATGGYGGYFIGGTSTDTLVIRGGSDLSERFDVNSAPNDIEPVPGMVVCIDAEHPGELTLSKRAYDRTVAGIISGAGDIETGMLMGQEGTLLACGDHPVALTGRVYCLVDGGNGTVQPGDLLTTSEIPGHAMKVLDHERAQGAIIGKAMTPLKAGRGLVLVLVSLQ